MMKGSTNHRQTRVHFGPAPAPTPGLEVQSSDIGDTDAQPDEQTPAPGAPLVAGDLVAGTKYRIVRFIGDGGMGAVYEAEHVDLERRVALKILHTELSHSHHAVELFRSEARTVSRIGADEIVQLHDFAELPDGRVMFTMELLEGPTLTEAITRECFSPARIISILRQICGGLAAAHAAGVVHRDVKPDNIVLDRRRKRETVKILDFGIATMLEDAAAESTIQAGTPSYLAPELITHQPFDHRSDIYALGCVAYEMCAGRPPFPLHAGEGVAEVLRRHVHDIPAPLDDTEREIPTLLEWIILRCLAKSPDKRFATVEDLDAALCEAQFQLAMTTPLPIAGLAPVPDESDLELAPVDEPPPRVLGRSRPVFWPLFAAACLLLTAGTITWALQRSAPADPVVVTAPIPMAVPAAAAVETAPAAPVETAPTVPEPPVPEETVLEEAVLEEAGPVEEPAEIVAVAIAPDPEPEPRRVHRRRATPPRDDGELAEEDAATEALLEGRKEAKNSEPTAAPRE